MLAVRWHGPRDVRLEDVELSLPLGPGMVEVAVSHCGICGSDVAEYASGPRAIRLRRHALSGQAPPLTLGHELAGVVVAAGSGVERPAVGERVAADACWRCERCDACRAGSYNLCAFGGSIGLCSDGGFAARVRFPAYAAVPLPDGVDDEAGAVLEPLAVALHALRRGSAEAGERVVVLGFGAIGAATAEVARASGLDVLVVERLGARRRRAHDLGYGVLPADGDARELARAVRRAAGPVRLVIDATGAAPALEAAVEMTARGGTIVVAGLPPRPVRLDAARLVLFERALVGSLGYAFDLPRAAALLASGALDARRLITRRVGLRDVPSELARLSEDPGDDLKVIVALDRAS
jgi:(R,R)-butanediol dehydrogenase/meso-butanediol dehydrogenase/diacetyl reductase